MRAKITIGVVIAAGVLLLLFLSSGGGEESVYYYTPSEVLAQKEIWPHRLRLRGVVAPGSIAVSQGGLDLCLDVQDEDNTLHVRYHGTIPEALREGLEVVVDGRVKEASFLRDARPASSDPDSGGDASPELPDRVEGVVDPDSVRIARGKGGAVWFTLGNETGLLNVLVHGSEKDLPRPGEPAVYEGRIENGILFEGSELIVKCPSKYESAPGEETPGRPTESE